MKTALKTILSLILICCMGLALVSCKDDGTKENLAKQFSSRDELVETVNGFKKLNETTYFYSGNGILESAKSGADWSEDVAAAPTSSGTSAQETSDDYTKTNVQTEGVDEGDIIKADGEHIYVLGEGGLSILRADNGNVDRLCFLPFENYLPYEMYVDGNSLAVIGGVYDADLNKFPYANGYNLTIDIASYSYGSYFGANRVEVRIYDISDKSAPVLGKKVTVDGRFNTSRLKDGILYYVAAYYFGEGNEGKYVPRISDSGINNGENAELALSDIYYFDDVPNYSYCLIGKINLKKPTESSLKGYLAVGSEIYVSEDNLYVTSPDSSDLYKHTFLGVKYNEHGRMKTRIVKIGLSDLTCVGRGDVYGTIKDRYSLDEYDGYLRIATTTSYYAKDNGEYRLYSNVYVLNSALEMVGQINNIAEGERIYSVRFNKTEGSLVTFRNVDPLFKLDLSDPVNPKISEGLKKDGVSYYLHYIEGTDYVIGLGRESKETDYGGVIWGGIEVVLFDYSGAEAVIINKIVIGVSGYCDALNDPKAILYDKDKNIFAFAATENGIDEEKSKDYGYNFYRNLRQGLFVFGFNSGELKLRACLSDLTEIADYNNGWQTVMEQNYRLIKRGARIGNYIYTVSNSQVTGYSLEDFSKTDSETIAKYTFDETGAMKVIAE